ncbi:hypothetical protein B566_EDAN008408 [Ephemera danica]|nr:hypothetical protein B566_EDAN008408 [Ephemera danica]
MPVQSRSQKLSKIETLRLARNYIEALSLMVNQQRPMDPITLARSLSRGLSQATANLVASSLGLSPRTVHMGAAQSSHCPEHVTWQFLPLQDPLVMQPDPWI